MKKEKKYTSRILYGLDKLISDYPNINIYDFEISPKKFIRVDDEKLILNCATYSKLVAFLFSIITGGIFFSFLYRLIPDFFKMPDNQYILSMIIMCLIALIMPFYAFLLFIKNPEYSLNLDRKEQLVTIKSFGFKSKTFGPYNMSEIGGEATIIARHGQSSLVVFGEDGGAVRCDKLVFKCTGVHQGAYNHAWSFILWYMDKNRPLPPGEVFDLYREKDDLRRKEEGYPKPLFPTLFDFEEEAIKKGVHFVDNQSEELKEPDLLESPEKKLTLSKKTNKSRRLRKKLNAKTNIAKH